MHKGFNCTYDQSACDRFASEGKLRWIHFERDHEIAPSVGMIEKISQVRPFPRHVREVLLSFPAATDETKMWDEAVAVFLFDSALFRKNGVEFVPNVNDEEFREAWLQGVIAPDWGLRGDTVQSRQ